MKLSVFNKNIRNLKIIFNFRLIVILLSLSLVDAMSQSIEGSIKNQQGQPIPHASILLKSSQKGTIANDMGHYKYTLQKGQVDLEFRAIGYTPKIVHFDMKHDTQKIIYNVVLESQIVELEEVSISNNQEDYAYSIMRKMITKAPFHLNEIKTYTANAYIKGSARLTQIPFLFKNRVKKEAGIVKDQTYVLESIVNINFAKPSKYSEKIVSRRDNFPEVLKNQDLNVLTTNPNLYQPSISGTISPLNPQSFQYYKFKYLGSFKEGNFKISKIEVKPKVLSDQVVEGELLIVEDLWSIYGFNFQMQNTIGKISLAQQCAHFNNIWMPLFFQTKVNFKYFGFGGDMNYVTQYKEYSIQLDPNFKVLPKIVDEKFEKKRTKATNKAKPKNYTEALKALEGDLTKKKLKESLKLIKNEEAKKDSLVSNYSWDFSYEVDSHANEKSDSFWNAERQVPLTENEQKGYAQADSIYQKAKLNLANDSLKRNNKFKILHLLTGNIYTYKSFDQKTVFDLSRFILSFTAVDGYYLKTQVNFLKLIKDSVLHDWGGYLRYASQRKTLNAGIYWSKPWQNQKNYIKLDLQSAILQINPENPIHYLWDGFYTGFLNKNYGRYLINNYFKVFYQRQLNNKLALQVNSSFQNRYSLDNTSTHGIFKTDVFFENNNPNNFFNTNTDFDNHNQIVLGATLRWNPKATKGKFNHRIITSHNKDLELKWHLNKAFIDYPYTSLQFSLEQRLSLGQVGRLQYFAQYNDFIEKPKLFIDYTHFKGNQTNISTSENYHFRNLLYYYFSTPFKSLQAHVNFEPRLTLLNRIKLLYYYGIKESLQAHFLFLENAPNGSFHYEFVYKIDGILRVLGIEFAYSK
ncbi:MAG: DUF5686 family protein, partial [Alphaproteobacteria bacterium]|nr:DUF5686 family protein [Alphaproteobacteria bacterium]